MAVNEIFRLRSAVGPPFSFVSILSPTRSRCIPC